MIRALLALATTVSASASASLDPAESGTEFTACMSFALPSGQFASRGRPLTCMELFVAEPGGVRDVATFFIERSLSSLRGDIDDVDPAYIEALLPYVGERIITRLGSPSDVETASRQGFCCPCV